MKVLAVYFDSRYFYILLSEIIILKLRYENVASRSISIKFIGRSFYSNNLAYCVFLLTLITFVSGVTPTTTAIRGPSCAG